MYYKLGKQDGLNTMWYPNGQKKWEILYINDIINKSTFWNEEGNITKMEVSNEEKNHINRN
jgi:antitoxin component YwqK of YwqJK toxin-antitoxin module